MKFCFFVFSPLELIMVYMYLLENAKEQDYSFLYNIRHKDFIYDKILHC